MKVKDWYKGLSREGLRSKNLLRDPFEQFERWFEQAGEAEVPEANAMSLATATALGEPLLRTVLLKFFDKRGFVFYTNFESKKAHHIAENPNVSLLFLWIPMERQVVISGTATKISTAESIKYFTTRPRGSQLGAWSSHQSAVISSRQLLEMKLAEMKRKFMDGEVPLPSFWGGYRVIPSRFEFWQGRENRLHDRFEYVLQDNGTWVIQRLAP